MLGVEHEHAYLPDFLREAVLRAFLTMLHKTLFSDYDIGLEGYPWCPMYCNFEQFL